MSESKNTASGGIGFFSLLTVAFIVLKLLNVITWSWFWVLSPIIFPMLLGIIALVVLFILFLKGILS